MTARLPAQFVHTDQERVVRLRQTRERLPSLVVKLAEVLQTGSTVQKPFRYLPQAFNARDDVLLRDKKYTIIDQMRRHPVIKDAMRAKRAVLIQGWSTTPAREKDLASIAVAKFVSDMCDRMRGGFIGRLRRYTNSFEYGFSLHEQKLEIVTVGPWLGMVGIEDWHYRLPHFLDFERCKETGRVLVLQRQPGGGAPRKAYADQMLWYVYQGDLDPWRGEGDLRSAYNDWWMCDTTEKLLAIHLEAMGTGKVKVGVDLENDFRDLTDEMLAEALKVIDNWQNLFALIEFPGLKIDLMEAGEPSGQHYITAIEHFEERMRQAIGKPDLMAPKSEGDAGSYARAKVQKGQHYAELGEVQNDIEENIPEQCFRPLLEANGIPLDYLPGFRLSPPEPDQGLEYAKAYDAGLAAGSLQKGPQDEAWYRQQIGAPEREAEAPAATPAAVPQPGALGPAAQGLARAIFGDLRSRKVFAVATVPDADAEPDAEPSTLWVRIPIPAPVADELAIPGGEAPEDLHITLAYVGRQDELPADVDPIEVRSSLTNALAEQAPLRARISGVGRFLASTTSEGRDVVYASVDAPGLVYLRQLVAQALRAVGLPPRTDHDFDPHITLAYQDEASDVELAALGSYEFLIDHITLGFFGEDFDLALEGLTLHTFAAPGSGGQFAPGGGRVPGSGGSSTAGAGGSGGAAPRTVKDAVDSKEAEARATREEAERIDEKVAGDDDALIDHYMTSDEAGEYRTAKTELDTAQSQLEEVSSLKDDGVVAKFTTPADQERYARLNKDWERQHAEVQALETRRRALMDGAQPSKPGELLQVGTKQRRAIEELDRTTDGIVVIADKAEARRSKRVEQLEGKVAKLEPKVERLKGDLADKALERHESKQSDLESKADSLDSQAEAIRKAAERHARKRGKKKHEREAEPAQSRPAFDPVQFKAEVVQVCVDAMREALKQKIDASPPPADPAPALFQAVEQLRDSIAVVAHEFRDEPPKPEPEPPPPPPEPQRLIVEMPPQPPAKARVIKVRRDSAGRPIEYRLDDGAEKEETDG